MKQPEPKWPYGLKVATAPCANCRKVTEIYFFERDEHGLCRSCDWYRALWTAQHSWAWED